MSTPPHDAALSTALRRIVVLCPSWVGDVVLSTPVLRALREHLPETEVIAVVRPGQQPLLAGLPWVDDVIAMSNTGVRGPFRLAAQIRKKQPDAGLLLPNSFRSAVTLRLADVAIRVGYARDGRSLLLTHSVTPPDLSTPVPMTHYYAQLATHALGCEAIDHTLELRTSDAEREAAAKLLDDVPGPFVLLNPGASKQAKRWPAARFAAVGDAVADSHSMSVAVTGSPGEAGIVRAVCDAAETSSPIDLVERGVTLGSLKAVIERASLLITNDTGPRHIAAALGTPAVSIFGPTDHRWTTLSGASERIMLAEPFLPEQLTADAHAAACTIDRVATHDVIVAAKQLLG